MQSMDRAAELPQLQESSKSNSQVWVKPTLERLALKDALAGTGDDNDGLSGSSS